MQPGRKNALSLNLAYRLLTSLSQDKRDRTTSISLILACPEHSYHLTYITARGGLLKSALTAHGYTEGEEKEHIQSRGRHGGHNQHIHRITSSRPWQEIRELNDMTRELKVISSRVCSSLAREFRRRAAR